MTVLVATAIAAPTLDAPKTASIGDPLTIRLRRLDTRTLYRATFTESAKDRRSGRQCACNVDRPFRTGTSTTRVYVFRGRVPRTLACAQGRRRFTIEVRPAGIRWLGTAWVA